MRNRYSALWIIRGGEEGAIREALDRVLLLMLHEHGVMDVSGPACVIVEEQDELRYYALNPFQSIEGPALVWNRGIYD